ncbi:MAG: 16S rRNA (uracil(1498)-N(3))-methyltransferase [Alphaproteobacteria bacterium]|nr:16S rRNA (uracil(1498)-N(3))-methyltransferase [Alphaproteobacteria bacterium]
MKNIPRIFVDGNICPGIQIPVNKDVAHYLSRVMRTDVCLVFGNGSEYNATLSADRKYLKIGDKTGHIDPSIDLTLIFAPIKRTDDLLNMATQMGVAAFQPVITARTNANHINWDRMQKIVIESAEQSNRNSVPKILPPIKFADLDLSNVVFADERAAHGADVASTVSGVKYVLVGPEGGFADDEFYALDSAGARGISLGKTILRAELAAAIAIAKVVK